MSTAVDKLVGFLKTGQHISEIVNKEENKVNKRLQRTHINKYFEVVEKWYK